MSPDFEKTEKRKREDNFRLEEEEGQHLLRFLPSASFADVRLYMRGSRLDGTEGRPSLIRKALVGSLGEAAPLSAPHQVHGTTVLEAQRAISVPQQPQADAVLLTELGLEASLRFADCAPLLLFPDEEWVRAHCPWVLLVHSGYKGTVQNIAGTAIAVIRKRFGEKAVALTRAWIGPCIGGQSYPRTLEDWTRRGLSSFHQENIWKQGDHFYFDIGKEIECQLLEAGLSSHRIFRSSLDTLERGDICYSYRGGDLRDRMFLWAKLLGTER